MIIRRIFYAFCVTFLSFSVNAQIKSYPSPPGTVKLSDHLFIDVAPVDNLMFIEYLDIQPYFSNSKLDSIIDNSKNYGLNRSDILKYIKKIEDQPNTDSLEVYVINNKDDYLRNPVFSKHPVINITKFEAIDFCKWRTKMVLLHYAMDSKTEEERNNFPKYIAYRLPTSEELDNATKVFGYGKGIKPKKESIPYLIYRDNYKNKNKKALFLKNNLSEYSFDSIAYGANWANHKPVKDANDFTTFRCICEVTE